MPSSPADLSASSLSTNGQEVLNSSSASTGLSESDTEGELNGSCDGPVLRRNINEGIYSARRESINGPSQSTPVSPHVPERIARENLDTEEPDHLHFPQGCELSNMEKKKWFSRVVREFGNKVVLKLGIKRLFIISYDKEITRQLTGKIIDGVQLVCATGRIKKILILNFPVYEDAEVFMKNENVKWVRRIKRYGEMTHKVLAGIVGNVPEMIEDNPGEEFSNSFRVQNYIPPPILCNKCSSWGHVFNNCKGSYRCRYCAGDHDSRICGDKIKNGESVPRKCVNCGLGHNANSARCLACPSQASGSSQLSKRRPYINGEDFPQLGSSKGGNGNANKNSPDMGNPWVNIGNGLSSDGVHSAGEHNFMMALKEDAQLAWDKIVENGVFGLKEKCDDLGNEVKDLKKEWEVMKEINERLRLRIKELEELNLDVEKIDQEEMMKVCADVINTALVPRGTTGKKIKSHIAYLRKNAPDHKLQEFRKAIYASRKFAVKVSEMMNTEVIEHGVA